MPGAAQNGKAFDSGDASLVIMGVLEEEWTKITYDSPQEHQLNYSGANQATSYSMGKEDHTCTLELYMAAVRKYEKAANGNLKKLKPFTISVSYINDDQEEVTDNILCKFKTQGRDVDGMALKKSFDMFVLDIEYGV